MAVKTGERLTFADVGVEVIVTTGGDADVVAVADGGAMLLPGKRFKCERTGIQVLVVKPGAARLECSGNAMALQTPKKSSAAD